MLTELRLNPMTFRPAWWYPPSPTGKPVPRCLSQSGGPLLNSGWNTAPWAGINDPIFEILLTCSVLGRPSRPEKLFTGVPPKEVYQSISKYSLPPKEGWTRMPTPYGNVALSNIEALLTDWDFNLPGGPNHRSESFRRRNSSISHLNYRGVVETNFGNRYFPDDPSGTSNPNVYLSLTVNGMSGSTVTSLVASNQVYIGQTQGMLGARLQDYFDNTRGTLHQYSAGATRVLWLQWVVDVDGVVLSVKYQLESFLDEWNWGYKYKVVQTFQWTFVTNAYGTPASSYVGLSRQIDANHYARFRVTVSSDSTYISKAPDSYGPTSWTPWSGGPSGVYTANMPNFWCCLHTGPSPVDTALGFSYVTKRDFATNATPQLWGENWCHESLLLKTPRIDANLRGLASISGKEAVDSAIASLQANNLENLAQLDEFRRYIDTVELIVRFYRQIKQGNAFDAGVTLLDLLANAYLLVKYGLIPSLSDAVDFVRNIGPVLDSLRNIPFNTDVTGHSSRHTFTIPSGSYPYSGMVCHYRSMVRFRISDSTLMGALLPAKALGVLPTLSNLWDLVPRSFMVDWYTNLSSKFDNIDGQIQALCLDVVGSVSTFEIVLPVPDDILSSYGCRSIVPPTLVRFERVVDSTYPAMYPTEWDFLPPEGHPDWKIGTALAWTTIRG